MAFEAIRNFKENAKAAWKGEKETFDAEKMSNPNFIAFMGRVYKDTADLDPEINAKELGKRYEIYKTEKKVVDGLDKIYKNNLGEGLAEVDASTRKELIREFIDTQLEKEPEYILRLEKKIERFNESEKTLNANKVAIKKYEKAGGVGGIEEKLDVLKRAKGSTSSWKKWFTEKPKEAVDKMKKEYRIDMEDIDEQIEEVTDLLSGAKGAEALTEKLKKQFGDVRKQILSEMEIAQSLAAYGREALNKKMEDIKNNSDGKSVEERQKILKEMEALQGEGNLEQNMVLNDEEARESFEEMREKFEEELQEKFMEEIADTITSSKLNDLEQNLRRYLKTGEVGDLSQNEARVKVREEVEKASNDKSVHGDKRFLLKALLGKTKHLV